MTGSRRLLPVLATAALAVYAAPARAQSGAGDDQYTDPFGSSSKKTQTTSSKPKKASSTKSQAGGPPLSNQPPVSTAPSSTTSTPPTTTTPSPAAAPSATGQLPRTGFEVPGVALLGAGLLATGIGLRLRTVDESLF